MKMFTFCSKHFGFCLSNVYLWSIWNWFLQLGWGGGTYSEAHTPHSPHPHPPAFHTHTLTIHTSSLPHTTTCPHSTHITQSPTTLTHTLSTVCWNTSVVFKWSHSLPLFHDHVTVNTNTATSGPSYLLHCPLGISSSGRRSARSSCNSQFWTSYAVS